MLLDAWRLSVGTLTALPLGLAVTVVALTGHGLPPPSTALLAIGVAVLGSRALHFDGFCDTADGRTACYDRAFLVALSRGAA